MLHCVFLYTFYYYLAAVKDLFRDCNAGAYAFRTLGIMRVLTIYRYVHYFENVLSSSNILTSENVTDFFKVASLHGVERAFFPSSVPKYPPSANS